MMIENDFNSLVYWMRSLVYFAVSFSGHDCVSKAINDE